MTKARRESPRERRHEVDTGTRDGATSAERDRVKDLEREVKGLRHANGILKLAGVFFVQVAYRCYAACLRDLAPIPYRRPAK